MPLPKAAKQQQLASLAAKQFQLPAAAPGLRYSDSLTTGGAVTGTTNVVWQDTSSSATYCSASSALSK